MSERLTIEKLLAATQTEVTLPLLGATILVRRISTPEHRSFLPALPPDAEMWGTQQWVERQLAWLQALTEEQRQERRELAALAAYRIVAAAALEPRFTFEEARRLGDDAVEAAFEILKFSGLAQEAPSAPRMDDPAPPAGSTLQETPTPQDWAARALHEAISAPA